MRARRSRLPVVLLARMPIEAVFRIGTSSVELAGHPILPVVASSLDAGMTVRLALSDATLVMDPADRSAWPRAVLDYVQRAPATGSIGS